MNILRIFYYQEHWTTNLLVCDRRGPDIKSTRRVWTYDIQPATPSQCHGGEMEERRLLDGAEGRDGGERGPGPLGAAGRTSR